jgi:hypothetical protein
LTLGQECATACVLSKSVLPHTPGEGRQEDTPPRSTPPSRRLEPRRQSYPPCRICICWRRPHATSLSRSAHLAQGPRPHSAKVRDQSPPATTTKRELTQHGTVLVKRRALVDLWIPGRQGALTLRTQAFVSVQAAAMTRISWCSLMVPLLAPAASSLGWDGGQEPLTDKFDKAACPDYAVYASFSQ